MSKIKLLSWQKRKDRVICSIPHGMKYGYYITELRSRKFELTLLNSSGYSCCNGVTEYHNLSDAIDAAQRNFEKIITSYLEG